MFRNKRFKTTANKIPTLNHIKNLKAETTTGSNSNPDAQQLFTVGNTKIVSKTKAPTEVFREQLRFPGNLVSDTELNEFYTMGKSPNEVRQHMIKRILSVFLTFLILMVVFITSNGKKFDSQSLLFELFISLGSGALVWYLFHRSINDYYQNFLFQRQLHFAKFSQILLPFLSEVKNGASLSAIFRKVIPRLDSENDKKLLRNLTIDMNNHPGESKYFVKFADDFSGTDRANSFMLQVFDIENGANDDRGVTKLGEQAQKDLMSQIDVIINKKIARFISPERTVTVAIMIPIFGVLLGFIISLLTQIMGTFPHA